jgi:aromatic ring-opening dioxygenase catalytic subunit (LigB family)
MKALQNNVGLGCRIQREGIHLILSFTTVGLDYGALSVRMRMKNRLTKKVLFIALQGNTRQLSFRQK